MPLITLKPGDIKVEVEPGLTVLDAIHRAGLPIASYCGGLGTCGKCRVVIESGRGEVSSPTALEVKHLGHQEIERGIRLACQVRLLGGNVVVSVLPEALVTRGKRAVAAVVLRDDVYSLNPMVKKVYLSLPRPTLNDNVPDFERLMRALAARSVTKTSLRPSPPLDLLKELPVTLRQGAWEVTVVLHGDTVVSVEPGDTSSKLYGLAVDVGSSKIIAHLVDLNTGRTLAESSLENPQITYGADIVTRAVYTEMSPEHLERLRELVVSTVNNLVSKLAERAGVSPHDVYEVVVVGNTVMHHIFLGIPPGTVTRSPYTPVVSRALYYTAGELGIAVNKRAYVYLPPLIGGFVGSDAVANILATQVLKKREVCLLVDIGTNTEVLLGNESIVLAASAPSGPAFEGAHISHGMLAIPGAIESISISGLKVEYETIGGMKPRGICGTGLVDLVAELYRNGLIDQRGKFTALSHPRVSCEQHPCRFIVVPGEESATGKDIYITSRDIEAVLLAVGAVKATWTILSRKLGITPSDLSRVYIAGSFGAKLNVENAIEVGLIPRVNQSKVAFIGESAIVGAKIALKSTDARREVEEFVEKRVKYVEVSADPEFREVYLHSMRLGT